MSSFTASCSPHNFVVPAASFLGAPSGSANETTPQVPSSSLLPTLCSLDSSNSRRQCLLSILDEALNLIESAGDGHHDDELLFRPEDMMGSNDNENEQKKSDVYAGDKKNLDEPKQ